MADVSAPDTTEPLADLFWAVARRLRHLSRTALAPWDVSPSHSRALAVLLAEDGLRLSELSDSLHIAPRSATEVVDALESRGLAGRRPDPGDRRATLVEVTDGGGSVLDAIRGSEAERVFARLSPTDRSHLARILRKLRE